MINVFEPSYGLDELVAVGGRMKDRWTGRGSIADLFESKFARYHGLESQHFLSITSCTSGLFLAIQALGIEWPDEVIIPTIHFVGAVNAVMAAEAEPVLVDVDPHTLNVTLDHIKREVTEFTKAIILLHYGGSICYDIEDICKYAAGKGITVIEDCACSLGAPFDDPKVYGDIAVWSFDSMKMLSTGDGGMIYARDPDVMKEIKHLAYLGMDEMGGFSRHSDRWWEYTSVGHGNRLLMNDMNAAIGLSQLKKIKKKIEYRWDIYDVYAANIPLAFEGLNRSKNYSYISPHFYWIQTDHRDELARKLRDRDIYTTFRYWPLHRALASVLPGYTDAGFPGATEAAARTLLLPLHNNLTFDEVFKVAYAVIEILSELE
jgi:aminotransferase